MCKVTVTARYFVNTQLRSLFTPQGVRNFTIPNLRLEHSKKNSNFKVDNAQASS